MFFQVHNAEQNFVDKQPIMAAFMANTVTIKTTWYISYIYGIDITAVY